MAALLPVLAQAPAASAMTDPLLSPVLILVLCVVAGTATVFLLPGHREMAIRKLAGAVLVLVGLIFAAMLPSLKNESANASGSIYFWIFSAIALASAVRVVTHPKPVYSALYFVFTVFASAGLFVLLEAEFMAAALILIYAGAILVTYVFVIMLASQATSDATHTTHMAHYDSHSREPAAAAAVGFGLMGALLFVIFDKARNVGERAGPVEVLPRLPVPVSGVTQELGMFLFRSQSVQLELAGIILLVSMVGAILISRRKVQISFDPTFAKAKPEVVHGPATPVDDDPHSLPVYGKPPRRQKMFS